MDLNALDSALNELPLVAILRGITPNEIDSALDCLVESGFRLIEVPLNSPQPFESIERLVKKAPSDVVIGAGTVLDVDSVKRLADTGASLMVTPNLDLEVLKASQEHGLGALVGCYSASEMFAALKGGAKAVKLFPADVAGTSYLKALKSVLPGDTKVMAVGGVDLDGMDTWVKAGINGFGYGGYLYKPGTSIQSMGERAKALVERWRILNSQEQ